MPSAPDPTAASASPARPFGHYALERVLGKSELTTLWLAVDQRTGLETMLSMPRLPPAGVSGLGNWLLAARRTARLDHPDLAKVADCGVHEQWPYVAVDRRAGVTLEERLTQHPVPVLEEATVWVESVLRGLAFAHDAGLAHHDLQLHHVVINERGHASVMALGVGAFDAADAAHVEAAGAPPALRAQRAAAEFDVLAVGLLLHRLLAGVPALDCSDLGRAIARVAPRGRELVRLPWTTPQPVPEALRAIANRSTSPQVRLRYRSARTFLGAIAGWREAAAEDNGGPIGLLLDRLHSVGHLPALPGLAARVQRVTSIESTRTDEIARHLLPDMALSFELLKTLSSARVQGTQIPGNGPVLTLRRIVALIGVDGVRAAANSLRTWPGALDEERARALRATIDTVRLAGHLAQALRPAGYDPEAVYLVAVLQNLGGLLLRYHFAEEAEQIRQLMQPVAAIRSEGEIVAPPQPGLDEEAAAYAVLGVTVEMLGNAAARQWGLGNEVVHMIRRLATDAPVRKPDSDNELLRIVASAANEAVEALALPPPKSATALNEVVVRYARTLRLTTRTLEDALAQARDALAGDGLRPAPREAGVEVAEVGRLDEGGPEAATALDREQDR
ncbi:MAG: HDOD domain-containing protein [Rhizobacter sp.]|nr:HDOD domain-containing protein [Rhizobacter sp.]